MGNKSNRCGAIMKDKASPQELASAKKEAVEGGMTKSVADGIFKDYGKPREAMAKDMTSSGVLYKKYCRK